MFSLAKRTNVLYSVPMKMTDRKRQILKAIADFQTAHGYSPSVREICRAVGLASAGSLQKHLDALEQHRFLNRNVGKKRTWKLTEKAWDLIGKPQGNRIPLVGRIAAGTPILAEQNLEEDLPVDPRLFGCEDAFAIRVQGDSMVDAHISHGDIAIVRPQSEAANGDIVSVLIDGAESEATLKILHRKNGRIELHAANSAYEPLVFEGTDVSRVHIQGKLIGVIRLKP